MTTIQNTNKMFPNGYENSVNLVHLNDAKNMYRILFMQPVHHFYF